MESRLFFSERNALSGITVTLSFGSLNGATSSGSLGHSGSAVVLVVTSGNFEAVSLSDTAWFAHFSPFAVSVTAMEMSEL